MDLEELALQHLRAYPDADTSAHLAFLNNVQSLDLGAAAPLARDSYPFIEPEMQRVPLPLDPDLYDLAQNAKQSNVIKEIYAIQEERNRRDALSEGDDMPNLIRRRSGRDQAFARQPDLGVGLNDITDRPDISLSDLVDEDDNGNANIDAHTLLHMIELCRNGLLSRDQENGTSEHNDFVAGLADMLHAHANGNGGPNGKGDELPARSIARRSPEDGIGIYTNGDGRRARDQCGAPPDVLA